MTTTLIADGHFTVLSGNDCGKYLSQGDMVVANSRYYKVVSKTYNSLKDAWLLVVNDMHVRVDDNGEAHYEG